MRPTDWQDEAAKPSAGCLVVGAALILLGLVLVIAGLNAETVVAWFAERDFNMIIEGSPTLALTIIGVVFAVIGGGLLLLGLPSRPNKR